MIAIILVSFSICIFLLINNTTNSIKNEFNKLDENVANYDIHAISSSGDELSFNSIENDLIKEYCYLKKDTYYDEINKKSISVYFADKKFLKLFNLEKLNKNDVYASKLYKDSIDNIITLKNDRSEIKVIPRNYDEKLDLIFSGNFIINISEDVSKHNCSDVFIKLKANYSVDERMSLTEKIKAENSGWTINYPETKSSYYLNLYNGMFIGLEILSIAILVVIFSIICFLLCNILDKYRESYEKLKLIGVRKRQFYSLIFSIVFTIVICGAIIGNILNFAIAPYFQNLITDTLNANISISVKNSYLNILMPLLLLTVSGILICNRYKYIYTNKKTSYSNNILICTIGIALLVVTYINKFFGKLTNSILILLILCIIIVCLLKPIFDLIIKLISHSLTFVSKKYKIFFDIFYINSSKVVSNMARLTILSLTIILAFSLVLGSFYDNLDSWINKNFNGDYIFYLTPETSESDVNDVLSNDYENVTEIYQKTVNINGVDILIQTINKSNTSIIDEQYKDLIFDKNKLIISTGLKDSFSTQIDINDQLGQVVTFKNIGYFDTLNYDGKMILMNNDNFKILFPYDKPAYILIESESTINENQFEHFIIQDISSAKSLAIGSVENIFSLFNMLIILLLLFSAVMISVSALKILSFKTQSISMLKVLGMNKKKYIIYFLSCNLTLLFIISILSIITSMFTTHIFVDILKQISTYSLVVNNQIIKSIILCFITLMIITIIDYIYIGRMYEHLELGGILNEND